MKGIVRGVMGMAQIVEIAHREEHVFTLEKARELLPIIKKVTTTTAEKVEKLLQQLEMVSLEDSKLISETEEKVNSLIQKWHENLTRLGVRGKGLWYVDFNNGSEYFCWKYPESDIFFKHSYQDGFTGRTLIDKSRPLPQETKECYGHHDHKHDQKVTWVENRSRSDQLTPWRL